MRFRTINSSLSLGYRRCRPLCRKCSYSMHHLNQPINPMEGENNTKKTTYLEAGEDVVTNTEETGKEVMEAVDIVV